MEKNNTSQWQEDDIVHRTKAQQLLHKIKQERKGRKFITVRVDRNTWVEREVKE